MHSPHCPQASQHPPQPQPHPPTEPGKTQMKHPPQNPGHDSAPNKAFARHAWGRFPTVGSELFNTPVIMLAKSVQAPTHPSDELYSRCSSLPNDLCSSCNSVTSEAASVVPSNLARSGDTKPALNASRLPNDDVYRHLHHPKPRPLPTTTHRSSEKDAKSPRAPRKHRLKTHIRPVNGKTALLPVLRYRCRN